MKIKIGRIVRRKWRGKREGKKVGKETRKLTKDRSNHNNDDVDAKGWYYYDENTRKKTDCVSKDRQTNIDRYGKKVNEWDRVKKNKYKTKEEEEEKNENWQKVFDWFCSLAAAAAMAALPTATIALVATNVKMKRRKKRGVEQKLYKMEWDIT